MLRSFALTCSVLLGIALQGPIDILVGMDPRFSDPAVLAPVSIATESWTSFAVCFIAVEWWLERDLLRRSARRRALGRPADDVDVGSM
jgi:hypothetical protein